jgi:hypothetical protein
VESAIANVTDEKSEKDETLPATFRELHYTIVVDNDKFDLPKMRQWYRENFPHGIERTKGWEGEYYAVTVAPRAGELGSYSADFSWRLERDNIVIHLGYLPKPKKHESDEREPFAEQLMQWLGQFFKYESAHAHVHGRFEYALDQRQSKLPLPLTVGGDIEAEIYGLSLRLPSQPNGVSVMRLTRGKEAWYVEVTGNIRINFTAHDLTTDIATLQTVIDKVLEEKQQ